MTNNAQKACADAIATVLADTHVLYMKAHNFHWNVEGMRFIALHEMFEAQYTDLAEAMDDLAERIRALGEYAPGTQAKLSKLASIKENEGQPSAEDMLRETVADYETIGQTLTAAITVAQEHGDEPTVGMLTDRLEFHEKQAWMMKSMLK
ncbi:MAG: Dps family protein [Paracoccaceae bacterium]